MSGPSPDATRQERRAARPPERRCPRCLLRNTLTHSTWTGSNAICRNCCSSTYPTPRRCRHSPAAMASRPTSPSASPARFPRSRPWAGFVLARSRPAGPARRPPWSGPGQLPVAPFVDHAIAGRALRTLVAGIAVQRLAAPGDLNPVGPLQAAHRGAGPGAVGRLQLALAEHRRPHALAGLVAVGAVDVAFQVVQRGTAGIDQVRRRLLFDRQLHHPAAALRRGRSVRRRIALERRAGAAFAGGVGTVLL